MGGDEMLCRSLTGDTRIVGSFGMRAREASPEGGMAR